jgi:general secretion pathway protein I
MNMRRQRGFTLIEIMIALIILSVALAAAGRAASVATDSSRAARLRTLATWAAQNRIAELTAMNAVPAVGELTGKTAMGGSEFEWQQKTAETPNAAFRKIELRLTQPGSADALVTLTAYLVRPPGK